MPQDGPRQDKGMKEGAECVCVWDRKRDKFDAEHVEDLPGNN